MSVQWRRVASVAVVLVGAAVLLGCAPDKYMIDRARDFSDCWDVGIGIGTPVPYVRVKVTDMFVMGAGVGKTWTVGYRGRYGGPAGLSTEEQWGIPLVRCVEEVYAEEEGEDHFQLEVETWGPMITKRWYPEGEGRKLGTEFSDYTWIGASVCAGVAFRFGLNPFELADAIVGIFLIDPLADDRWVFAAGP